MIRLKSLKAKGIKKLNIPSQNDDFEKLEFPEEGEILVHGSNESGKSTMFESIYFALFGTALVPDRSTSSMSQLLNYGKDRGVVELEFKVDETIYKVKREIKENTSGMNYKHRLEIGRPGQEPKEFRGKEDVNSHIQEELGLDGDSLLNSCFVQQKNLDRLESRNRSEREDSISTLLNLDKFTELEEEYSSKLGDLEEKVERKEIQLDISKLENKKIPGKEDELSEIRDKLEIKSKKSDIREKEEKIEDELQEQLDEIEEKEEKLPEKEELFDKLEGLFEALKEKEGLQEELDSLDEIEEKIEEAEENLEEIDETLPDKKELRDFLINLKEDQEDLEEWREKEEELDELEENIENLKEENEELEEQVDEELIPEKEKYGEQLEKKKYKEHLGEWKRLQKAANQQEQLKQQREELEEKEDNKESEKEEAKEKLGQEKRKRKIGVGGGLIFSVISGIGLTVSPLAGIGIILGIIVAAYSWITASVQKYNDRKEGLEEDLSSIDTKLTKLEGAEESSKEIDSEDAEEELEQVENDIKELEKGVPESKDEAEKIEDELEIESDLSISKLEEKLEEVKESITEAETTVENNEEKISDELKNEKEDYDRDEINIQLEELENSIAEKKDKASKLADELDKEISVDPENEKFEEVVNEIRDEVTSAGTTKQDLEKEIEGLEEDKQDYDREKIEEGLEIAKDDIENLYNNSVSKIEDLGKDIELERDREEVNSVKSALDNEINQNEKEIEQKKEIEEEISNLENEIEDLQDEINELEDNLEDEEIERSEEELEGKKDELTEELGALKSKKQDLEEEINYEEIDVDSAEEELKTAEEKKLETEYSEKIVSTAKHNIMDQILPKTESNMARFLPILTNGKYKDVSIDQESFDVEVYDSKADELKNKSVFSGGTRDQFSLALRLSFAMATLPQERGSAPDFLFLDEPIGAFDQTRKESLMELLTRGEIAENFSQIFVISHIEDLKGEFDQHIKMEEGRIEQKKIEV